MGDTSSDGWVDETPLKPTVSDDGWVDETPAPQAAKADAEWVDEPSSPELKSTFQTEAAPSTTPETGVAAPSSPATEGAAPSLPAQDTADASWESDPEESWMPAFMGRSWHRVRSNMITLGAATGAIDGNTAAKLISEEKAQESQYKYDPDVERAFAEYEHLPDSYSATLGWARRNPKALAVMFGDNAASFLFGTAATAGAAGTLGLAAGPVGAGAGAVLGAAGSSAILEGAAAIEDFLSQKGIDLSDEEQVRGAFANSDLMSEAKAYAAKRGVAIGAIDGITSLLGIKGAGKLASKPLEALIGTASKKAAVASAVAQTAGNVAIEGAGAGVGEAGAQLWTTGEVHAPSVLMEALIELPGSVGEGAISTAIAGRSGRDAPASADEIQRAYTPGGEVEGPSGPSSFDEATKAGRTFYGYDDGLGGPVRVTDKYEDADEVAGKGDVRRGSYIAVKPEETELRSNVSTDEVVDALTNRDHPNPYSVTSRIKNSTARAAIQAAEKKWRDTTTAPNVTPVESENAKTQFQAAVSKALELDSERIFSGDTKKAAINPRVQNLLEGGSFDVGVSGNADKTLRNTVRVDDEGSGSAIDLDALKSVVDREGAILRPGRSGFNGYGATERGRALIDATFEFSTPEARQQVLDHTLDGKKWMELWENGSVKWKGQYDARFLVDNFNIIEPDAIEIDEATKAVKEKKGKEGDFLRRNKLVIKAKVKNQKNFRRHNVRPSAEGGARGFNSALVGENLGQFSGPIDIYGLTELGTKFGKWAEQMLTQMKSSTRLVFVEMGANFELPTSFIAKYPKTALEFQTYYKQNQPGGTFSYLSEDLGLIIIRDYQKGNPVTFAGTVAHEMGHFISAYEFGFAPLETQLKIQAAWRRMVSALDNKSVEERRRIARKVLAYPEIVTMNTAYLEDGVKYYYSFEEFMAEQTNKWAFTNRKAITEVDAFFKGLARKLLKLFKAARAAFGGVPSDYRPEAEMENYLNAIFAGKTKPNWYENARMIQEKKSAERNAKHFTDRNAEIPRTTMGQAVDNVVNRLGPVGISGRPAGTRGLSAHVDRWNRFYKWAIHYGQLADLNPNILPLQRFRELMQFAKLDFDRVAVGAEKIVQEWRRLKSDQAGRLTAFLFDLNDQSYLSAQERTAGVRRWPTGQEFLALAQQHGLSQEGLRVYRLVNDEFLRSVKRIEDIAIQEALRLTDPKAVSIAIAQAKQMSKNLTQSPYYPQMRFGEWALIVKDGNGKLEHFELFETKGSLREGIEKAKAHFGPGFDIYGDTVPQEARPFVGVPAWLLDKMLQMPGLSQDQTQWMQQLRYQLSPAVSFRKRLLKRKNYAGYSRDGIRVFASYMFHHAKFYSRTKWDVDLRTEVENLRRDVNKNDPSGVSKRNQMADLLEKTYQEFRNPSADWAILRAINAIWHLGAVPASAALNLTQTIIATQPYLSSKFKNDAKVMAAMMKVAGDLSSYYKKGTLSNATDRELKAIDIAIKQGLIDESMAAELAATAVGGGLHVAKNAVGDRLRAGYFRVANGAMFMFRMAEQWNRRVSFRSAYKLAMENHTSPWLQELKIKHHLVYQELVHPSVGFTEREALAFLAGKETIQQTQFSYDRLSRPRFMQGRKSVLFAFYMFTQNSMFMLWNNKGMRLRYFLILTALAGVGGLVPEDVEDIAKAIAKMAFGKDFDLERAMREHVAQMTSAETADYVMGGIGRHSFGMKPLADMVGATWVPDVDMSKSIALQRVLPGNPTAFLKPGDSFERKLSDATQSVAGAAYGIPLAIYKALSGDPSDLKTWEPAIPRALRNMVRAGRLLVEGGDRDAGGNQFLEYDKDSPEDVMEIMALAMGFRPTRANVFWDRATEARELDQFWTLKKEGLMREAWQARESEDKEDLESAMSAIREHNKDAPDKKYKITLEGLKRSFVRRAKTKAAFARGDNPYVPPGIEERIGAMYPDIEVTHKQVPKP
jgi:hypothetical protein